MDKLNTILLNSTLGLINQDTATLEAFSSNQNYLRVVAPYTNEWICYGIFYPTNSDNNVGIPAEYMLIPFESTETYLGSTYYGYEVDFPPAALGSARANKLDVTIAFIQTDEDLIGVSLYDSTDAEYIADPAAYIAAQLLLDYLDAEATNYVRVFNTETDWVFDGTDWSDTDDITLTNLREDRSDTVSYAIRKGTSTSRPTHAPTATETIIAALQNMILSTTAYANFLTITNAISTYVNQSLEIIGLDLANDIGLVEFKVALGNASSTLDGLMSTEDKVLLDAAIIDIATNQTNANASKIITDYITLTGAINLDTVKIDSEASKVITDYITLSTAISLNQSLRTTDSPVFAGVSTDEGDIDTRINLRALISDTDTTTEINAKLALKAPQATTYSKNEVDALVSSLYRFKGSVATYADLAAEEATAVVGDVWNVVSDETTGDAGVNYAWTGSTWDNIGGVEALASAVNDGLMSKEDFSKLLALPTNAELVIALGLKVDKVSGSSLVTDLEIAHLVALDTQAELQAKLDLKAAIATTYTRTYIDTLTNLNGWTSTLLTVTPLGDTDTIANSELTVKDKLTFICKNTSTGEIDTDTVVGATIVTGTKFNFFDNASISFDIGATLGTFTTIADYELIIYGYEISLLPENLEKVLVMTYDTAGKFYYDLNNYDLATYDKYTLLFPNTLTDLTTAVTISLDNGTTYKGLKYSDTDNDVLVSHTQLLKTEVYYDGTEFIMKGDPLLDLNVTYDKSVASNYGDSKLIKGSAYPTEVLGLSLNSISYDTDVADEGTITFENVDGDIYYDWCNKALITGTGSTITVTNNTGAVSDMMVIDITNTPLYEHTAVQLDAIIPTYFEGRKSIEDFELSSYGVQLFDGELEEGSIDNSTGINEADTDTSRSVNYTLVKPNTNYFLSGVERDAGVSTRVYYYDENKNFISNLAFGAATGETFETLSNCTYIRFRYGSDDRMLDTILNEGTTASTYTVFNKGLFKLLGTTALSVGKTVRDRLYPLNDDWYKDQKVGIALAVAIGDVIDTTAIPTILETTGVFHAYDTVNNEDQYGVYGDTLTLTGASTVYFQLADIVTTEITYSGSVIQESTTTLVQTNVNGFATEYDIKFAMNVNSLVGIHDDKIKEIRDDVDANRVSIDKIEDGIVITPTFGTNCLDGDLTDVRSFSDIIVGMFDIDYSDTIAADATIATLPTGSRPTIALAIRGLDGTTAIDFIINIDGTITNGTELTTSGTVSFSTTFIK